jgi:hypothetical protein
MQRLTELQRATLNSVPLPQRHRSNGQKQLMLDDGRLT